MATFDDYLRDNGFLDIYQAASNEQKVNIFANHGAAYAEWLKLKNPQPQPAPGISRLRSFDRYGVFTCYFHFK